MKQTLSASWLTKVLAHPFALLIVVSFINAICNTSESNAFFLRSTPLLPTNYARHHNFSSPPIRKSHLSAIVSKDLSNNGNDGAIIEDGGGEGGIYRPFANYAWSKLSSSGLTTVTKDEIIDQHSDNDIIPSHLQYNSSPARGPEGSIVSIEIKSRYGSSNCFNQDILENNVENSPLRLGRFALLETLSPSSDAELRSEDERDTMLEGNGSEVGMVCAPGGIHVLNLVMFPNPAYPLLTLPILGIDLVTLPGGKHLIAIDFQPVLPLTGKDGINDETSTDSVRQTKLFPEGTKYAKYEDRIAAVYERHVKNQPDILPWGGDIPPNAQRFFSPYALWTRLSGDEGLSIVKKEVYKAFCDYFDLYLELLVEVQGSWTMEETRDKSNGEFDAHETLQGHREYLTYRQDNDPARPMLTRLYGEEWTEEAIGDVLFKMI